MFCREVLWNHVNIPCLTQISIYSFIFYVNIDSWIPAFFNGLQSVPLIIYLNAHSVPALTRGGSFNLDCVISAHPSYSLRTSLVSDKRACIFPSPSWKSAILQGVLVSFTGELYLEHQDLATLMWMPFSACLGSDSLLWPPWGPLHYSTIDLAWPYLLAFGPHSLGGREKGNLLFYFSVSQTSVIQAIPSQFDPYCHVLNIFLSNVLVFLLIIWFILGNNIWNHGCDGLLLVFLTPITINNKIVKWEKSIHLLTP